MSEPTSTTAQDQPKPQPDRQPLARPREPLAGITLRGRPPGSLRPADNHTANYSTRDYSDILALQRTAGNRAVSLLLQAGTGRPPALQAKLIIGRAGDSYEQEADRVADQVMQGSYESPAASLSAGPNKIQRKCAACSGGGTTCPKCAEEEEIQRKPLPSKITPLIQRQTDLEQSQARADSAPASAVGDAAEASTVPQTAQARIESLRNGGRPLPGRARAFFESRLNYDFRQVHTHTGPLAEQAARAVNARAFTVGRDVFFGAGQYAPDTTEGRRLLAHELTHVVQQTSSSSHAASTVQRQPAPAAPAAGSTPAREATAGGMIVEDEATDLKPGQMKKSEFLAELRARVCRAAEAVLAGTGRTTVDCPYLDFWFGFYNQKDSRHIERALRRYAPEAYRVTTARGYISVIVDRVRRSVQVWAKTGKVTGIPEDMPADLGMAGPSESGESSSRPKDGIQFKAHSGGARGGSDSQAVKTQLGSGSPLDGGVRSRMETAFGRNFSHVRVHTDARAAALSGGLNARAFTVGEHIAFDSGEYRPGSLVGDAIIAHELAHVMQQESASNTIAPTGMGQGRYEQFEEDADQSAVEAATSLWGRTKGVLSGITQSIRPRLKSGLQLQSCKRTVKVCPKGLDWQVVGRPTATGPVCVCVWRCLPPGTGYSIGLGGGGGSGHQGYKCPPPPRGARYDPCTDRPVPVEVDEDYEKEKRGKVISVGAHMSPLGGQGACGCLPLTVEGDPTGRTEVHAPMLPPGLDITDVLGARSKSTRTGEMDPGKQARETKPTETKPTVKGPTETTVTKPAETTETKPTITKPTETTETKPPETKPTETKPTETPETKPKVTETTVTKPPAPQQTAQQTLPDKVAALQAQHSSKLKELEGLQQRTGELEKKAKQAEEDRKAAWGEYNRAKTREEKQQASEKMRAAVAEREKSKAELEKVPSKDSLEREVKKLEKQIEAETPKPAQAQGRDPLDVEIQKNNPKPPPPDATGKIGESPAQDKELQKDIANAKALRATDIRVNQHQVNAKGIRVGINRPDLQYTLPDGTRVYIEYDTKSSGRGPGHKTRILDNDPDGKVDLKIID